MRKAHCHLADRFSDVAFRLLGGTWARAERCSTFRLRRNRRELGMARYALYVATLSGRRGQAIMRWRGNMSVGKANNRLKLAARGRSGANALRRSRAAA